MSNFDSNPFADPSDVSPFQDPSVTEATANSHGGGLEEFNPFEATNKQANSASKTTPVAAPLPPKAQPQPAVMAPTSELPPAYTQSAAQPAVSDGQAELQRRQDELEQKAAELTRREQQMRNAQFNIRENNWPPLPKWFPLQPCFYQDFAVDIPLEFQRTVKLGYYLWIVYLLVLFINMWIALVYFSTKGSGICFGLSILFLVLNTPFSFICWYRPMYKAFRSDSSFNFFLFFFIFFFQFLVTVVQAIGIDQFGTVGWVNGLNKMGGGSTVSEKAIAGCMLIVGALFTTLAVLFVIYLQKVHALYRGTGASFSKAQEEFARGVVTNPGVQTASREAAASAVSGATTNMFSGGNNRM